jgi:hypothetical protein
MDWALACDASMVVVEEDAVGNMLNIGRRSRVIPAGMTLALSIRDGGRCQFPGCCESRYVEGHHIVRWANGGETKLVNLVTMYRFHHRELHCRKFFLSLKAEAGESEGCKQLFAERLCFSPAGMAFNGRVYKEGEVVIAAHTRDLVGLSGCKGLPGAVVGGG